MAKEKLPKIIQKKINDYLRLLRQDNLHIQQVVLFGSWARGQAKKDSDIDLCVISKDFNKIDPWQYLWSKRIELDDYTIQPIGFTAKNFKDEDPLVYEIKKIGIAW